MAAHRTARCRHRSGGGSSRSVECAAVVFNLPLILGLEPTNIALLALTFVVGAITLGSGRTNMMQGAIHLIIFAAFLFLTLVP
jgi:Ca2+:H+ antiporter